MSKLPLMVDMFIPTYHVKDMRFININLFERRRHQFSKFSGFL